MLKIIVLGSTVLFGMVYWGIGAFLSLMLYVWPIPVQNGSQPYVQPSDVQLSGSVIQAQPTNLQVGENVQ